MNSSSKYKIFVLVSLNKLNIVVSNTQNINLYNKSLPELNSFVLPGGNELSIRFHLVRVKCRKVERFIVKILKEESIDIIIVKYLNRMSDLFFVLSRYSNCLLNNKELTWDPNC